jgi:hypothetical protein
VSTLLFYALLRVRGITRSCGVLPGHARAELDREAPEAVGRVACLDDDL